MAIALRGFFSKKAMLVMLVFLQALLVCAALRPWPHGMSSFSLEIDQIAADWSSPGPGSSDGATADGQGERELLTAVAESWARGDEQSAYRTYADLAQYRYEHTMDSSRSRHLFDEAFYRALGSLPDAHLYQMGEHVPASLWLVSADKGALLPLAQIVPGLMRQDGSISSYNDTADSYLWLVPIVAVCAHAARLQRRGRLVTLAPARASLRFIAASLATTAVALLLEALMWLPAVAVALVRGGWGSLSYPVVYGSGSDIIVKDVGTVLLQYACLMLVISLAVSLLMQLSVLLVRSAVPGTVLVLSCLLLLMGNPAYYERTSPFYSSAALLPFSYLDVARVVGEFRAVETPAGLPGVTFGGGMVVYVVFDILLAFAVALIAELSQGGGVSFSRGLTAARAASVSGGRHVARPSRSDGLPCRVASPRHTAAGTNACVDTSSMLPSGIEIVRCLDYARYLTVLLVSSPAFFLAVFFLGAVLFLPFAASVTIDVSAYQQRGYRDNDRVVLSEAARDGSGGGDAEALLADLDRYLSSKERPQQYRELATYLEHYAASAESGVTCGMFRGDPASARAQASLLRALAPMGGRLYTRADTMPALVYLSYVMGSVPAMILLVPIVAISWQVARLSRKGTLLGQVPFSGTVVSLLQIGVVVGGVLISFLLVFAVVVAIVAARNGIGAWDYPALAMQWGGYVTLPVGTALARTVVMLAAASAFVASVCSLLTRVPCGDSGVVALLSGGIASLLLLEVIARITGNEVLLLFLRLLPHNNLAFAVAAGTVRYQVGVMTGAPFAASLASLVVGTAGLILLGGGVSNLPWRRTRSRLRGAHAGLS